MKPYVESGRVASSRLSEPARGNPRSHCIERLRGFKQVINVVCVFALLLIPVVGLIGRSPGLAAVTALSFLLIIWLLEVGERGVKRELAEESRRSA